MEEVEFLFDTQLINKLTDLISGAKGKLVLISPYIDLDARIMDVLHEKLSKPNFEVNVLFGKNEGNYLKSFKRDSLTFLKQFPNIEIRYNERLHAKFYQNDFEYIMTSLNLYDYSLANNIEVGIYSKYNFEGLLGQAIESGFEPITKGVSSVKEAVLGKDRSINPIEKFEQIFQSSELKYKTKPNFVDKSGLQGFIGLKKLSGFDVIIDKLSSDTIPNHNLKPKLTPTPLPTPTHSFSHTPLKVDPEIKSKIKIKSLSASQLAKSMGVTTKYIIILMQKKGLVVDDKITEMGFAKGLTMKTYMGNDYIAYPENLPEFQEYKKL